jgi:hypothetical protein
MFEVMAAQVGIAQALHQRFEFGGETLNYGDHGLSFSGCKVHG